MAFGAPAARGRFRSFACHGSNESNGPGLRHLCQRHLASRSTGKRMVGFRVSSTVAPVTAMYSGLT
jgi:hypothetical protein